MSAQTHPLPRRTLLMRLFCERIGPHLKVDDFALRPLPCLGVEWSSGAVGTPDAPAFPARVTVIYPAVQTLGIKAQRIGDAKDDPLSVDESQQSLVLIAGCDRDVVAQSERIELVDPVIVRTFRAPGIFNVAELRTGHRV